ncbi:MAG: fasciclin domain-containing protein [Candidatus Korarchaeota archaeon]|nr:fasciclin domain-containing protein [Candidatus Korarchaeota archaeon]
MKNIVETAIEAGTFRTLVEAVKTAGLVRTLSGRGPFTVFAPNDSAFAKLPSGTLEKLLRNKEKLTSVLTYHVVPGKVMATDVMRIRSAKTVQGQNVSIDTTEGVKISGANVIKTDIECTNGVIHVIDRVIMPK